MTTTLEPLSTVEEPLVAVDDLDAASGAEELEPIGATLRIALCLAGPVLGAAVMVGGVFQGVTPRAYAGVAGLLGVGLAAVVSRLRRPVLLNLLVVGGIFGIGLLVMVPTGVGNLLSLPEVIGTARAAGKVLRPPVPLEPGWVAIIGWLMAILGFTAGWVAFVLRRPALGLLLPLPVAGISAISVPDSAQVGSGIAVLALFAMGLGLLSGAQAFGPDDDRPPVGYEVRRAIRAIPLVGVITVAMYFLAQANFLFPNPVIDPTKEPQKPKTVPLSAVQDRVLFEVKSEITGPWRIGSLDVYDGKDWRLPAFSESKLKKVPSDGVVDHDLKPGVAATFTVKGLEGAVLINLPNPVGIIAEGPALSYDQRSGNIRTTEGDVKSGLTYEVVAAALPTIGELTKVTGTLPEDLVQFTDIPKPPPAVVDLISKAPKTSKWAEFDYLRRYVLDNVTVTGAGVPVSVPPSKVQDMLAGSKEGSPFEIVAAQAMLARWMELPSRIGYGFDGGEKVGDVLQVRPKHGATFVEVYFPTYKWLPVIGTPKKAKATIGKEGQQQTNPNVLPSTDISVQLYLPVITPPKSVLLQQIRRVVEIVVPVVLLLLSLYFTFPLLYKARVRARRRRAAFATGPRARIALAYAEWRDYAADYGYRYPTETPLMFLDRFVADEEQTEFAWLVTRALWGDLDEELSAEHAALAEELSRALRRRLARAHPGTLRAVAAVSRLSMRYPYAPETDLTHRTKEAAHAVSAA